MNFSNILSHIAEADPEIYERTSQRRRVIKNWMRGVTLTALPFALGSLFKKAYGQTNPDVIAALNFALKLEYLEEEFYTKALQASLPPNAADPLIPSGLDQSAIIAIRNHESQHVTFLQNIIATSDGVIAPKPEFDFTGGKGNPGGSFPTVFTDYDVFLAVAQTLEDTGVRAYKTGIPTLMADNNIITAALRIHSAEARHAAHIRLMRHLTPSAMVTGTVRPWITGNNSNINSADVQKSYNGEDNTLQANIQITGINGQQIAIDAASESFDEPLTMEELIVIVDPFLVA
jgi:hypothetical protein